MLPVDRLCFCFYCLRAAYVLSDAVNIIALGVIVWINAGILQVLLRPAFKVLVRGAIPLQFF